MTTALLNAFQPTPAAPQAPRGVERNSDAFTDRVAERERPGAQFEGILNNARDALENAPIGDDEERTVNRLAALSATSGNDTELSKTLRDLIANLEELQLTGDNTGAPLENEAAAQEFLGELAAAIEALLQKLEAGTPASQAATNPQEVSTANLLQDLRGLLTRVNEVQNAAGSLTIDGDRKSAFQDLLRDVQSLANIQNQQSSARLEGQSLLTQAQLNDTQSTATTAQLTGTLKAEEAQALNVKQADQPANSTQSANTAQPANAKNIAETQVEEGALRFVDQNQSRNTPGNNQTINELAKFTEAGFKAGEGNGFVSGLTQAANQTNAPVTDPAALAALLNNQTQQRGAPGQTPTLPQGLQLSATPFADETLPNFTSQITRQLVSGRDQFTVQLNPAELGRVDVRLLNNEDGTVNARIQVERSETLDLFQRDLRALERSLAQSGIKLSGEGIDLSLKNQDQGGNSQNNPFADLSGDNQQSSNSNDDGGAEDANSVASPLIDDLDATPPSDIVQTLYARIAPGQLNIQV